MPTSTNKKDFVAWYRVVKELPGVGFYNSAQEAGASQRHKHMQVRCGALRCGAISWWLLCRLHLLTLAGKEHFARGNEEM